MNKYFADKKWTNKSAIILTTTEAELLKKLMNTVKKEK